MGKERPKPLEEAGSSLVGILNVFIAPLLEHAGEVERTNFLAEVFDSKGIQLQNWVSYRDFILPGLYYVAGNVKLQGVGFNKITIGTVFTTRMIAGEPTVDIEFRAMEKDHVFCLSAAQWSWVRTKIRPTEWEDLRKWREIIHRDKRRPERRWKYL